MQKASKIARFAMMNLYMLSKINWFKFIKNYSKKSDNVVWLNPGYPKVLYRYVTSGILENDLALIKALLVEDRTFRILFGQDAIYKVENKTIYYNLSYNFLDRKKGNPPQYIME